MLLITIERPIDTGQSITAVRGEQKKTPESWLQGRLLFMKESPVGPEQGPLDYRQKDDDSRRWDQSTPVWRAPIPLHGDNASQALTGPHFIAIKWT